MSAIPQSELVALHDQMSVHVKDGACPGLITAVTRGDQTSVDVIGHTSVTGETTLRRDAIFRISSMTKPVVAFGVLQLVADGRLTLDQEVGALLPELAAPRVLVDPLGPITDTAPADRGITVRDLLTYRAGFGFDLDLFDAPVLQAAQSLELAIGPPVPATPLPPVEWLRRLGSLPLLFQPGRRWLYDTSANVLGVLISRAAGVSLPEYLQHNIFEPLGMVDTAFWVPPDKLDRFLPSYGTDEATGDMIEYDNVNGQWSRPPVFPSGANGLVSTVDDLLAFGAMMLDGAIPGMPALPSQLWTEMTTDQLTADQHGSFLLDERGWGYGLAVNPSTGHFGWDGGLGTSWVADPNTRTTGIVLTQRDFSASTMAILGDFSTFFRGICR